MSDNNPYQAPKSDLDSGSDDDLKRHTFVHLAHGQKMTIFAIVLYFVTAFIAQYIGLALTTLLILAAFILGLVGLIRILLGSEIDIFSKIILFIAMFIPLVNILALARINYMATSRLKAGGYSVGLFGVREKYKP